MNFAKLAVASILTTVSSINIIRLLNKDIYTGKIEYLECNDCKGNYNRGCNGKYTILCNHCLRGKKAHIVKKSIYRWIMTCGVEYCVKKIKNITHI